MDQAAQVRAVLERSVLPSVVARGGDLRVRAVEGGVVTLEASGSPGATLPLIARIETLLRSAVPGVASVRVASASDPRAVRADADLADRVRHVLDGEVNPAIAAHRGHVALVDVEQGWVRVRLEGGCQGCSLAEVTLRQGIEPLLRTRASDIVGVIDVTDHAAGKDPFFSPAKR
jgi:Fe-S cluster biogenesis protein NfuA